MSLGGGVLGAAIAAVAGITVPPGPAAAGGFGDAVDAWIVSNAIVTPLGLVAAGAVVTGTSPITLTGSATSLRDAITTALGVTDPPGLAVWLLYAQAWHTQISTNGKANPTAFVASGAGGPVTGTGILSFTAPMTIPLGIQMGMTGLNIALWALIEATTTLHLTSAAVINSLGFTSPSGGGPLVGASTIS